MNDLSAFMEGQRAAGQVESVGSFTLALEKAVKKLSSHALVHPEDYLLKLVQCAVRLGVKELHVRLLKRAALVFFETEAGDRTVSVDALSRSLAAPLEESDPARSYLALAICAVAGQNPKELMWGEWDDQGEGTILSLAEGRSEVFRDAPFPRTAPLDSGRRFFLFFLSKASSRLSFNPMSAEQSVLTGRCAFAPMPILLDGVPLAPTLPTFASSADPVAELTSPYLGALTLMNREGPRLRWPAVAPSICKGAPRKANLPEGLSDFSPLLPPVFRLRVPAGFTSPMFDEGFFSELSAVPIHLYGSSYLYYVKDGVMLHPVKGHEAGGGAFAILDGSHLKTDLTGLQVVQDTAVEADFERMSTVWKGQVDLMLSSPAPVYENRPLLARESTFITALGCCFLGPFGLLAHPVYQRLNSRAQKQEVTSRKLTRQLELRRGYLAFNRKEKPA